MSKELQEKSEKFYQYTAIDEYSRLRYTWFTNAHDTYASSEFARRLVKYFPFKIKTIQTDNGFEFTNRLSWQAFLKDKKIKKYYNFLENKRNYQIPILKIAFAFFFFLFQNLLLKSTCIF